MKKSLLILAACVLVMNPAHGKNLSAFFSYCTFDQPVKGPYLETYLNVSGTSVKLAKNSENKWQGKIEIQCVFKQDDKIIHFDKYNLLSPLIEDTLAFIPDFIDQQRVALPNGDYTMELKITDKNASDHSYAVTQQVSIYFLPGKVNVSDIELLESYKPSSTSGIFSKNGYELVPLVTNYFPKSVVNLKFYAEIYNAKEILGDDDFLVTYSIQGNYNKQVVGNLISRKRQKSSAVNIIMAELPLNEVRSGNYLLNIQVHDKTNKLLVSKDILFQRSNPAEKTASLDDLSVIKIDNTFVSNMTDKDTLADYISCIYPISTSSEADVEETQLKYNRIESMQQFFYYFWSKRNRDNPEQGWMDYKREVDKVNAAFSCTSRKGYESDRGRVYLQYGVPSSIDKTYFEGSSYPYEIWQYDYSADQTNISFVFLSRNQSANCFELIHSTAKGEFYDANWQNRLTSESKSNAMHGNVDRGDDYSHKDKSLNIDSFNNPK